MARKKSPPLDQLEALRRVRKPLPPPTRSKTDEKRYRRAAARRRLRQEVERDEKEE